jgi:hypothetical protein
VIVGSLLLVVVAVGLLVVGVLQGANALLVASIAASLLAAVALIVGGRQVAAARAAAASRTRTRSRTADRVAAVDRDRVVEREEVVERQPVGAGVGASTGNVYGSSARTPDRPLDETSMMAPIHDDEPYPPSIPQQTGDVNDDYDYDDDDDDEPEDEPPAQQTSPGDAARVATMHAEVFVVDGRPRYHLRGCIHMVGRESEPLPVSEAVELGFTPCSICEPDSSIVAAARRV